jgi:hypothetical protein
MTGAIEFMKAWRDICKPRSCESCPLDVVCSDCRSEMSDENITEFVRQVMAEARKKEARKK